MANAKVGPQTYLILVGAVSFAFGDTLIAFDRYYEKIPSVRYAISTSYYLAQFLLAYSVMLFSQGKLTMRKSDLQAKASSAQQPTL